MGRLAQTLGLSIPTTMLTEVKATRSGFTLRRSAADESSESTAIQFDVLTPSDHPLRALIARKKESDYWDAWFDIEAINDSPITPRLSPREVQIWEATSLFAQVVALPSWNRYIIHDIVDDEASLDTAFTILFSLLTLLRTAPPRTKSAERVEESAKTHKLKSSGLFFQNARTSAEQGRVQAAFLKLRTLGYQAFEVDLREFALSRNVLSCGTSFQGKFSSLEALESEIQRLEGKSSGWRSWF